MKFWHWAVLIAVMFGVAYVFNAKVLAGVPFVGKYASA